MSGFYDAIRRSPEGDCFYAVCACCGGKSHSVKFPPSEDPETPPSFLTLYREVRAARKLQRRFNRCPLCRRYVCDECYRIEADCCIHCASAQGETQTPSNAFIVP